MLCAGRVDGVFKGLIIDIFINDSPAQETAMPPSLSPEVLQELTARIHAHCERPRIAMVLVQLLLELADRRGVVQTTRVELGFALRSLLGDRGYEARRQARRDRLGPLLEDRDRLHAMAARLLKQSKSAAETWVIGTLVGLMLREIEARIGDPTGHNISRTMGELEQAGILASRDYIDRFGQLYDRAARGRTYYLTLGAWLVEEGSE